MGVGLSLTFLQESNDKTRYIDQCRVNIGPLNQTNIEPISTQQTQDVVNQCCCNLLSTNVKPTLVQHPVSAGWCLTGDINR